MLRQLVRKLILEIYELSPEDKAYWSSVPDEEIRSPNVRRALGLQSKEDIIEDRNLLQDYQMKLRQHPDGKAMIEEFTTGGISICHSPFYEGYAAANAFKDVEMNVVGEQTILRDWLRKYGKNSKDALSCVAFNRNIGDTPMDTGTNIEAFEGAIGFYMKGFPVYVNENDVMSQTLGALPPGLVKHQKNSGIAKRAGIQSMKGEIYGLEWHWAGEVLLDNWQPIGIYIDVSNAELDYSEWPIRDLMEDALRTGLPLYMFDGYDTSYGQVKDIDSFISDHGGLY